MVTCQGLRQFFLSSAPFSTQEDSGFGAMSSWGMGRRRPPLVYETAGLCGRDGPIIGARRA